ncbi:MAG TPA: hypothetical protein VF642_11225 [Propionibacteriaceae bacterium]|jgi:hypothetical protein
MSQPPFPQHRPQAPGRPRGAHSYETRRDVEAALAAQRELGPEYADQVAEGLADRVEQLAAYRTAELRHASQNERDSGSLEKTAQTQRFVTALVSLGAGIPITGIAVVNGGLPETLICWAGIVGVNLAQALSSRRRR